MRCLVGSLTFIVNRTIVRITKHSSAGDNRLLAQQTVHYFVIAYPGCNIQIALIRRLWYECTEYRQRLLFAQRHHHELTINSSCINMLLIRPGIATAEDATAAEAGVEVLHPGPEEKAKRQSGHNHIGNGFSRHKALLGSCAYWRVH